MDLDWLWHHSLTESTWLPPKHSTWRWVAHPQDQPEQAKHKQQKIYHFHSPKLSMCSTVPPKWIINQWVTSTRDWLLVVVGDVSTSSTDCYHRCYLSVQYSSKVLLMLSNTIRNGLFCKVIKSVWIPLVVSSLQWIQVILVVHNFHKVLRPFSDLLQWWYLISSWFVRTCWWLKDLLTPRCWLRNLSHSTVSVGTCYPNNCTTIGDSELSNLCWWWPVSSKEINQKWLKLLFSWEPWEISTYPK